MPTLPHDPSAPETRRAPGGQSSQGERSTTGERSAPGEPRVDLVLPCLNEARALVGVLSGLPPDVRAIVVDNGSTDDSAEVARTLGAHLVFESRRGFGAAVHAGVTAATAEVVAICDADGSFDLNELHRVTGPVLAGDTDLMLGRRKAMNHRAWPVHARLANFVLARLVRLRTGLRLHDLGPMRAVCRQTLLDLDLRDRRSGYPLEMVLRAHRAGLRVRETPVSYRPRQGRSKVTGTLRGTLTAITDMSRLLREDSA